MHACVSISSLQLCCMLPGMRPQCSCPCRLALPACRRYPFHEMLMPEPLLCPPSPHAYGHITPATTSPHPLPWGYHTPAAGSSPQPSISGGRRRARRRSWWGALRRWLPRALGRRSSLADRLLDDGLPDFTPLTLSQEAAAALAKRGGSVAAKGAWLDAEHVISRNASYVLLAASEEAAGLGSYSSAGTLQSSGHGDMAGDTSHQQGHQ